MGARSTRFPMPREKRQGNPMPHKIGCSHYETGKSVPLAALRALWLTLLLLSCGIAPTAAQQRDIIPGAEDVLEIAVQNHPDLDKIVMVLPDGTFTYPAIGTVSVAGKSLKSLTAELQIAIDRMYNNAMVSISIREMHSQRVRVIGAVKAAGSYQMQTSWRLLDGIAAAGGTTAGMAHIAGRIVRSGTKLISIDPKFAVAHPDTDANPVLEPGDLILLEERELIRATVFVMGQAAHPGATELAPGMTLLGLLATVGGPTEHAALVQARILRGAKVIPVDLSPLLAGRAEPAAVSFALKPGDVLFIPEIEERIAVMGRVNRPGAYPIPEHGGLHVLDALNLAGGALPNGDTRRIGIVRTIKGVTTVLPVDLEQMLKKGDMRANCLLRPNDILYIPPQGTRRFGWTDVIGTLTLLDLIGFRF